MKMRGDCIDCARVRVHALTWKNSIVVMAGNWKMWALRSPAIRGGHGSGQEPHEHNKRRQQGTAQGDIQVFSKRELGTGAEAPITMLDSAKRYPSDCVAAFLASAMVTTATASAAL